MKNLQFLLPASLGNERTRSFHSLSSADNTKVAPLPARLAHARSGDCRILDAIAIPHKDGRLFNIALEIPILGLPVKTLSVRARHEQVDEIAAWLRHFQIGFEMLKLF